MSKWNHIIYESILIGSSLINQVLESRTGREESGSESSDMKRTLSIVADFEDEVIEPRPKEYRWPLEARKGEEPDSP